jgi:hypothetical protein
MAMNRRNVLKGFLGGSALVPFFGGNLAAQGEPVVAVAPHATITAFVDAVRQALRRGPEALDALWQYADKRGAAEALAPLFAGLRESMNELSPALILSQRIVISTPAVASLDLEIGRTSLLAGKRSASLWIVLERRSEAGLESWHPVLVRPNPAPERRLPDLPDPLIIVNLR